MKACPHGKVLCPHLKLFSPVIIIPTLEETTPLSEKNFVHYLKAGITVKELGTGVILALQTYDSLQRSEKDSIDEGAGFSIFSFHFLVQISLC